MIIAHNISALNTYKSLGIAGNQADNSMEKLSSGYKINKAADDAAGLSISEKMRSQIRGLNQASTNAENGVSMIQTAEGALNEEHAILQRMRELAVQAATDTNATEDREALQSEMAQLSSEINRIGNTTEFNGMKILNGDKSADFIEGGKKTEKGITFAAVGSDVPEQCGKWSISLMSISGGTEYLIGGKEFTATSSGDGNVAAIQAALGDNYIVSNEFNLNVIIEEKPGHISGESLTLKKKADGSNVSMSQVKASQIGKKAGTKEEVAAAFVKNFNESGVIAIDNKNGTVTLRSTVIQTEADKLSEENTVMTALVTSSGGTANSSLNVTGELGTKTDNSVYFHVGANSNQVINTGFNDMRATALGIVSEVDDGTGNFASSKNVNNGTDSTNEQYSLNITTREGANNAIEVIDAAIKKVSNERSKYGAIQNRLEYTINNLNTTAENMTAAESTIRDVDMADEMMEYTKNNILQQAAQAMLVQANARPQQALQLLQ